ncbi:ArsR/SmtB family transcription factor [Kordiimonas lacus]|uniref:Helix-turn-helix domain-containing protein n=1 Tax=Kordiimonas lacus TaxID=637679 RepID=A0A1G6ZKF7_9PROT|nr:metalloregulator ArsR/SmtB family transcription factor [Kordiimonas lacus]SDE03244.1 Helix-turn-helix domain-containing protein [Kordiimonas lacus]
MENEKQLDTLFHALADRRRRLMLEMLAESPKPVSMLAEEAGLKASAASKNIAVLEAAGLLYKSRQGRVVYCHMNFDAWKQVAGYVAMHARFWSGRLNELERYLKEAGSDDE